jgi:PKD repeat protein
MRWFVLLLLFAVSSQADTVVDTIQSSTDDASLNNTTFSTTATTISIGNTYDSDFDLTTIYGSFFRFTALSLAQGADIDSAFISLRASANRTGTTCNATIKGEDTADAATFSNKTDYDARIRTTASVSWSPGSWTANTRYLTPNIGTIIQEIVDRGDWSSGNDLVVFINDNSSSTNAYRTSYTQNHASYGDSVNAILTVYYTTASPPDANFGATPLSGARNLTVQFTDSSTGTPTSWKYRFGDGDSATTQNPSHVYDSVGTYSVKLIACNGTGCDSLTRTNYISVTPQAKPTAYFEPYEGADTVADSVYVMEFRDSSLPAAIARTYTWDWGDGTDTSYSNSSPHTETHSYDSVGVFDVRLIVSNLDSADTMLRENFITIRHGWMDAAFTGSPLLGLAPCTVDFVNTSSGDTLNWRWDFGDLSIASDTSVASSPTYIYDKNGVFTVRLIAVGPVTSDTLIRTNYISVYEEQSYLNATRHAPGGVGMNSVVGATTLRHGP